MPIITSNEHILYRNKSMRNELLSKTDYMMLTDNFEKLTPEQKEELINYRQLLRDFININRDKYLNEGVKFIEFPKPPEFVGEVRMPKY